jgi:hypothetical protein
MTQADRAREESLIAERDALAAKCATQAAELLPHKLAAAAMQFEAAKKTLASDLGIETVSSISSQYEPTPSAADLPVKLRAARTALQTCIAKVDGLLTTLEELLKRAP